MLECLYKDAYMSVLDGDDSAQYGDIAAGYTQ